MLKSIWPMAMASLSVTIVGCTSPTASVPTGSGGSSADAPTSLSYPLTTLVLLKGIAASSQTPTKVGGAISSCSASPALPAGLSLNASTCALTGTPTAVSAATSYTVTASNSAGSAAAVFSLAVFDISDFPAHSLSAESASDGQVELNWLAPSASGGSAAESYRIHRSTSAGFTAGAGNLLTTVTAPTLTYTDASVVNGTRYYYQVVAIYAGTVVASASLEATALPLAAAAAADANNVFMATTGNDTTGDGSLSNPYLTLNKSISMVNSGGTIFVQDGSYALTADETINKAVTIQSVNGDYRSSAAFFVDSPVGTQRTLNITASNVSIKGIEGRNIGVGISGGLNTISFINNYFHDNKNAWLHYSGLAGIPNFTIYGNFFQNFGLRAGTGGYSQTASVMNYWPNSGLANLNNNFSYNRIENPAWAGFQIANGTGITLRHNTFTDMCDSGIQLNVHNSGLSTAGTNEVAYNTFNYSHKAGGHASCSGAAILVINVTNFHAGYTLKMAHNDFTLNDKILDFTVGGCDFTTNNPTLSLHSNNFESNNTVGVDFNTCVGNLNLSNNYWGAVSGPSGNGSTGAGASINIGTATGTLTHNPFSLIAY